MRFSFRFLFCTLWLLTTSALFAEANPASAGICAPRAKSAGAFTTSVKTTPLTAAKPTTKLAMSRMATAVPAKKILVRTVVTESPSPASGSIEGERLVCRVYCRRECAFDPSGIVIHCEDYDCEISCYQEGHPDLPPCYPNCGL
jgi:hypothetical protein